MRVEIKILGIASTVLLLSSCANYGYISENDVYYQKPTEISLDEDETDITSFNAFNARQRGLFRDEYVDPRINQRSMHNQFMLRASYMPFDSWYGWNNSPMAFHGMGYNSFYGNYYGFPYRYGYGYGMYGPHYGSFANPYLYDMYAYGSSYYYNPYHYGFANHYGYNPYYHGGFYGGYYGGQGSYYGENVGNNNQGTYHYGHRSASNANSRRSSNYENTLKKTQVTQGNVYTANSKTAVARRHAANMSSSNNVASTTTRATGASRAVSSRNTVGSVGNARRSSTAVQSTANVNRTYTPNNSMQRRTGVSTHRNSGVSTSGTIRRGSNNVSPATRNSVSPSATPMQQSRPSTISRGSATPRGSVSTPSSTRSSSGNSGRR